MRIHLFPILLLTLTGLLFAPSGGQAHESHPEKHVTVALRMAGHQVLLQAGDSSTRVLPIEKENGRYRVQFDTEFQFYGEDLTETVNRVLRETKMEQRYILEVEECATGKVVYSYEMGDLHNPDILPCKTRLYPKACYSLFFTFLNVEATIASLDSEGSIREESDAEQQLPYFLIAMLFLTGAGILVFFQKKRAQPKSASHLIAIGDYRFDRLNAVLWLDQQQIGLTSKEADLLFLLYEAVNMTLERDVILNKVWGDEGAYVGRTLDVFISKLRKKLEIDPKVKIMNIRGVGYKLVVDSDGR